ncbi:MAG TPA: magnesium chelatase, partial [Flavisolibacter sp.]|nr:magnesium chelatase [Flavisolibacter sp.]
QYFPNPETMKKRAPRKGETPQVVDNPYRSVTAWFDKGNNVNLFFGTKDKDRLSLLYSVDGLHALVKKTFKQVNDTEAALLMEFVLHGLSSYSLISKKIMETSVEFKDLMGSMLNIQASGEEDEDEDFN